MPKLQIFDKPFLEITKQIDLLSSRGLVIDDREKASHYLHYIGYYRLSGYLIPFKGQGEKYIPGTSFAQILDLYFFDKKLRILTFDAIESIEVALRNCITSAVAKKHGVHWFSKQHLFENQRHYEAIYKSIKDVTINAQPNRRDVFIRHYYDTYNSPELPPSWMVFEALSMGTVSLTLKFIVLELRNSIAKEFHIDEKVLVSWIHALVYTRNLCAHHSRLWNRTFTIKPMAMKRYKAIMLPTDKFHAQAVVIQVLLKAISPDTYWQQKLQELFSQYPNIDKSQMGFSANWLGFNL